MYEPKYKNLKFKTQKEFKVWLKENTIFRIEFRDKKQDFLEWWIDKYGEVLHSDGQTAIWNGKMVDIKSLRIGNKLKFQDGKELIHSIKKVINITI